MRASAGPPDAIGMFWFLTRERHARIAGEEKEEIKRGETKPSSRLTRY